jgi:hypothetical protein
MPVSFNDLIEAFLFVNSGGFGNEAFVDKKSGKIYWRFGHDDEMNEELPDDIEEAEKYIPVPDKRELDLGKPLVLDFTRQYLADDFDQVSRIFSRRGAYGNFKDLLVRRGALDQWHDFENKAQERALRAWCVENSIETAD